MILQQLRESKYFNEYAKLSLQLDKIMNLLTPFKNFQRNSSSIYLLFGFYENMVNLQINVNTLYNINSIKAVELILLVLDVLDI